MSSTSSDIPLPEAITVNNWFGHHLVSITQLDHDSILQACRNAFVFKTFSKGKDDGRGNANRRKELLDVLSGRVLANVFYEPSTRTMASFAAAMERLGGSVLQFNPSTSSSKKGETLQDSIRCLQCYTDVTVLRHPESYSSANVATHLEKVKGKPLLNAGDGKNEHPTQALLDLFTILETGQLCQNYDKPFVIGLCGDLKYGRTVHSLVKIMRRLNINREIQFYLIAPDSLQLPEYLCNEFNFMKKTDSLYKDDLLSKLDVLYMTRIQKERFPSQDEYDKVKGCFCLTLADVQRMKVSAKVLHPLPRVGEIKEEVDSDERAGYFDQMENGMYMRMALLSLVVNETDIFAKFPDAPNPDDRWGKMVVKS
eukprot:g1240.t1